MSIIIESTKAVNGNTEPPSTSTRRRPRSVHPSVVRPASPSTIVGKQGTTRALKTNAAAVEEEFGALFARKINSYSGPSERVFRKKGIAPITKRADDWARRVGWRWWWVSNTTPPLPLSQQQQQHECKQPRHHQQHQKLSERKYRRGHQHNCGPNKYHTMYYTTIIITLNVLPLHWPPSSRARDDGATTSPHNPSDTNTMKGSAIKKGI